jgi:PAS domain S-box-containing protein
MASCIPTAPPQRAPGPSSAALFAALPVATAVFDMPASGSPDAARLRCINAAFAETFGLRGPDIQTLGALAARTGPDADARAASLRAWCARADRTDPRPPPVVAGLIDSAGRMRRVLFDVARQDSALIVTVQEIPAAPDHELTAHALTENMPAGAYTMVQPPGGGVAQFGFVSTRFLDMLGLTREEALGDPATVFSRVHPDDRPDWIVRNLHAFDTGQPFSGETRIVAHGRTRWVRAESNPRRLDDGRTIWEGVLVDITCLKETQERLNTVIEAARAFTWHLDLLAGKISFNERWADAEGLAPGVAETDLESWLAALHPEDLPRVQHAVDRLLGGEGDRYSMAYRRMRRDGAWIWLQVHAGVSARDRHGRPATISGVSFDITAEMDARRRAEANQALLREELQRARQRDTVSQVASGVAHDLNNLIAVVSGTAEMLERATAPLSGLRTDTHIGFARIRRAVGMAKDLIAGLGELGRPELPRAAHDLRDLVRDSVELLGTRRAADHAIRVSLPAAPQIACVNPTEIAQVIVNLVLNACGASAPGAPAKVSVTLADAGAALPARQPEAGDRPAPGRPVALLRISDTGTGITDAVRAQMFRPHFTTKGHAGTGLGLLIVSTILQDNGAALWVDSTPGKGSVMTVAWPLKAPDIEGGTGCRAASATPAGEAPALEAVPPEALSGINAMVVADRRDVGETLAEMLRAAGATTTVFTDADSAMARLTRDRFWSVLVTDLHMPRTDGWTLARAARRLPSPVAVVLVTARPDALEPDRASDFNAVLAKPVSQAALVQTVFEAVRTGPDARSEVDGPA